MPHPARSMNRVDAIGIAALLRSTAAAPRRTLWRLLMLAALLPVSAQAGFDHSHAAWTASLSAQVVPMSGGSASQARYAGFQQDRPALNACLDTLSAVPRAEFAAWGPPQRMAFLINAYNAYTVELILSRYPDLQSIKDLGNLLQSPWKKKFFQLLGEPTSLDNVEQDTLRKRGAYDDPRIHFAVKCASIGCPMLREEAFVAERIDAQLDDQAAERFMSDRSRNRYNAATGRLEVLKIFDWYADDFKRDHKGIVSALAFYARCAVRLSDVPTGQEEIRAQNASVSYLDHDLRLDDVRR